MGGLDAAEKPGPGGRSPGKIDASLNEKLASVEWGEYRIGDLFEIHSTHSFNADKLTSGTKYDYVTRTSTNQGIFRTTGFVNSENINESNCWSLGLLQMDFFYRTRKWYAGQFVRKVNCKISIPLTCIPFFTTILNNLKTNLLSVLVRDVNQTFCESKVFLPTSSGKIDFDFIESFIAELEAQRIARLDAYLSTVGLKDATLTDAEKRALSDFSEGKVVWKEYRIGSLFERIPTNKLPYKAKDLPKAPTGDYTLPCLTSSFNNQGLSCCAPRQNATILKGVISIPSNSDVYRAYYQSTEFTVLSDAYAIRRNEKEDFSPNQYLFMVACINKRIDLPIYSYKNKLGGWNVVKDKLIHLPVRNGAIDVEFMEFFVSAIKKRAAGSVVTYSFRKSSEVKAIISK